MVVALIAGMARPAAAGRWWADAGFSVAASGELEAAAPDDRRAALLAARLELGRRLGSWSLFARLDAGMPLVDGRAGAGIGVSRRLAEARQSGWLATATLAAGGGVALSFIDAPIESEGGEGVIYWGPVGRLELAARLWAPKRPGARARGGLFVSLGLELTRARYTDPASGRGWRGGPELALGGVLAF